MVVVHILIYCCAWLSVPPAVPSALAFLVVHQQDHHQPKKKGDIVLVRNPNFPYFSVASDPTSSSNTPNSTAEQKKPPPLPPGRPTIPLLNVLFDDTTRLLNPRNMKLLERKQRCGPIFKTNFLFRPTVFVTDESSIQELAKEEVTKELNAFFPPHHHKLFGPNSLLVQSGPTHQRIRTLVMSSMTPAMISSYEPLVKQSIESFLPRAKARNYCIK